MCKFRKNFEVSDFDQLPENLNPNGHVKPFRINDNAVAGYPWPSDNVAVGEEADPGTDSS